MTDSKFTVAPGSSLSNLGGTPSHPWTYACLTSSGSPSSAFL